MTLLLPAGLIASVLAAPIVLMYVLRLRRRPISVSSTMLWQRALDDVQANAPWQRLHPNVLLLLQLLVLAALVLALARPAYSAGETYSGDLIVIVDQSYGMTGHDVHPSRFAIALHRARVLAGELGSGNVMSVIGMGEQPTLEIAESSNQTAIDAGIDRLRPTSTSPNFLGALSLAASLARAGATTQVVVLTSRESGIAHLPLPVTFPVTIERIGGRLRDLGITAFDATRGKTHTAAVLRVSNFGPTRESSDLDLSVDGQLADVRPISLGPGDVQSFFWTDLPVTSGTLRAHLSVRDDVEGDKVAWAVVPSSGRRRVLLVASGDYFLQTALGLDPSVVLRVVAPSAYTPALARAQDLVIFDGVLPGGSLPGVPTLLVGPPAGRYGALSFGAEAPAGQLSDLTAEATGPAAGLLGYVDLSDVHVARARSMRLPGWLQPIAGAGNRTVIAAGESGASALAVIDFKLSESDWPLRISFPLVIQNLVHMLAPGVTVGNQNVSVGERVSLTPPASVKHVDIVQPDGRVTREGSPYPPLQPEQPGIYRVREGQATVDVAARFFPARPAPVSGPAIVHLGRSGAAGRQRRSIQVSAAWALGVAGLALLAVEWWVAFRPSLRRPRRR